jgi:hypothetical protein
MISGFGKSTDNAFNLDVDNLQVNESEEILGESNFYDTSTFNAPVILNDTLVVNGPIEAKKFTATDATNQFIVKNASEFDLKVSTSTNPTFKFLDANNSLATSTIEANVINAAQINNTQTISANTSNDLVFSSQKNSSASLGSSAGYVVKNSDNDSAGIYIQSTAGGKRGQVRSSTTAFGLDLQTDGYGTGANKSIKLFTDHTTVNSDLSVLSTSVFYDNVTLNSGSALLLNGGTSGTTTLKVPTVAGTYDFILPSSTGITGQVLTSSSGNTLTWTTPTIGTVTSIGMSVPNFLSVTPSTITTSGIFAVTLSGTALPILNGGTGSTTATGTGSVVLQTSPTLINPTFSNNAIFTSTDPALNSTTGALQIAGGISVNKKSYIAPSYSVPGSGQINGVTAGLVIDRPSFTSQNNVQLEFGATVHIKGSPDYLANIDPLSEGTSFSLVVEDITQLDILVTTGVIGCGGGLGVAGLSSLNGGALVTGTTTLYGALSQSLGDVTLKGPSFDAQFTSTVQLKAGSNFSLESTSTTLSSKVKSANKLNLEGTNEVAITSTKLTTTISGETNFTTGSTLYKTTSGNFEMESFEAGGFTTKNRLSLESTTSDINLTAKTDMKLDATVDMTIQSKGAMLIKSSFTTDIQSIDDFTLTAGDATHQNSAISINTTLGAVSINCQGGSVSVGTTGGDIELDASKTGATGGNLDLKGNKLTSTLVDDISITTTGASSTFDLATGGGIMKLYSKGGNMKLDTRNAALTGGGTLLLDTNKLTSVSIDDISITTTGASSTLDLATGGGIMKLYSKGGDMKLDTRNVALTGGGELFLDTAKLTTKVINALLFESTTSTLTLKTTNQLLKLESNGGAMTFDSVLLADKGKINFNSGEYEIKASGLVLVESTGQQTFKTTTASVSPINFTTSGSNFIFDSNGGKAQFNLTTTPTTGGDFNVYSDKVLMQTNNGFKSTVTAGNYDALVTAGDMDITVSTGKLDITAAAGAMTISTTVGALNVNAVAGLLSLKGGIITATSLGALTLTGAGVTNIQGGGALTITGLATTTMTSASLMTITAGNALLMTVSAGAMTLNVPGGALTCTVGGGLLALTCLVGGITLTTGAGVLSLITGVGKITIGTGGGDIDIGTGVGGNVSLLSGIGAVTILANQGGVNVGCTDETDTGHPLAHFAVKTKHRLGRTGNISFVTAAEPPPSILPGPGNFTVDTSLARVGQVDFNCKGQFRLKAGGDGYGHYIYFNTTAMTADYFFTFPSTAGSPGQFLTTQGDGQIMTWTSPTLALLGYYNLTTSPYVMVSTSPYYTNVTVSSGGSVQISLPDATTLLLGSQFVFNCNGTTPVHLKTFTNSSIVNINPGSIATLLLTSNSTSTGVWDWHEQLPTGTKWSSAALTTPSTITTENVTDASALNTGALISLGGASISKKIYMGDTLYTNWSGTAVNRSSVVCSPGTNGTESSIRFTQNINDTGALWVLGHNVALTGSDTLSFYSSTFGSWVAKFDTAANFVCKGQISSPTLSVNGSASTGAVLQVSNTATANSDLATFYSPNAADNTNQVLQIGKNSSNAGLLYYQFFGAGNASNQIRLKVLGGASELQVTSTAAFATGQFYTKGTYFANWDQAVTNGTAAIIISPTVQAGEASIGFRTDLNNTGGLWKIGQNVGASGDNVFGFYSGTANKTVMSLEAGGAMNLIGTTPWLQLNGSTSGYTIIRASPAPTNWFFTLPSSAGTAGQLLTSSGGNNALTWTNPGTSSSAFTTPVTITLASATPATSPALGVDVTGVNTTNFYANFFSSAAPDNSSHTILMGVNLFQCARLQYNYISSNNTGNYFSIGGPTNTTAFKFYQSNGKMETRGAIFANYNQGVTNGDAAIIISPTVQGGQASMDFRTDLSATGRTWRIGQNVNGQGDDNFCFYNSTYNGNVAYFNNSAFLTVENGVLTKELSNPSGDRTSYLSNGNIYYTKTGSTSRFIYRTDLQTIDRGATDFAGGYLHMQFFAGAGGAQTGRIFDNGSNVSYATSSDYRLKQNIVPLFNNLARINLLKPCSYEWTKAIANKEGEGFIAHELQEIVPLAVFGKKDGLDNDGVAQYQSVDYAKLTPLLTGGIQELYKLLMDQQTIIETLSAKISLLEQK